MASELHDAALLGDGERVKSLLTGGADVNGRDAEGQTPLYLASGAGDLAMVKLLVENGADVTARIDEGTTPLHIAVMGNNTTVVAFLLGRGADTNAADGTGMTPLHCAALDGDKIITKALIAKGADPAVQDNDGRTPIHFAQDFGHPEIVDLLQQVNLLHRLGDDDLGNASANGSPNQPARGTGNAQSSPAATTPLPSPSQPPSAPSSPTKPCSKCGASINVTAKFCGQCGTPTQAGPQTAPSSTTATTPTPPSPAPSPAVNAAKASDALPRGTKLQNGAFAVSKVLGQGGFGITYYGGDMNLHRYVAIKEFFIQGECVRRGLSVVPKDDATVANFTSSKARFLREARTLARFDHPGIVRVYSVLEENNTVYMVMEFLKGQTLMELVESRGALPESEAIGFITKIGAALEKVHGTGLLHRDINPSNILACDDGRVVLIDFGLTKEIEKDTAYGTRRLSGTAVLGTASYAPIEQYSQSSQFGPPTDLYALGATLYHLLSGKAPLAATARAAGDALQPLHEVKPGVTLAASRAVAWAMEMEAAKRPQSVTDFLDRLAGRAAVPGKTVPASPVLPTPPAPVAPAPISTSAVNAVSPAGAPIIPLAKTESYSVKVSARILEWPFACACCGGQPDASFTASFTKQRGKHVIRQSTDSWQVPYCSSCLKHHELLGDARQRLNEANQVRPVSVPIPAPVSLVPPTVAPLPAASTGTVVLSPSQTQPTVSTSTTVNTSQPGSAPMQSAPNEAQDLVVGLIGCFALALFAVSFIAYGLGWLGATSAFGVFSADCMIVALVGWVFGSRSKNSAPSKPTPALHQNTTLSGTNPPAVPTSQSLSQIPATAPGLTNPQASKKALDDNAALVSSLLIGGFFILPVVFRLTGLAATFTNAFIAIVVIYIFVVPAVWLVFKMYYAQCNEQLEAWNKTAKARQQADDANLDAARRKAKEEQARRQAAQDAAFLAAKKQAVDETQIKIGALRAQAQATVTQAQALMKPTCCDIHAAATYEGGYASIHTFTFKNWEYAEAFTELNEKKVID